MAVYWCLLICLFSWSLLKISAVFIDSTDWRNAGVSLLCYWGVLYRIESYATNSNILHRSSSSRKILKLFYAGELLICRHNYDCCVICANTNMYSGHLWNVYLWCYMCDQIKIWLTIISSIKLIFTYRNASTGIYISWLSFLCFMGLWVSINFLYMMKLTFLDFKLNLIISLEMTFLASF